MKTPMVVLILSLLVAACGGKTVVVNEPDGRSVEMPADEYRAQKAENFMLDYQQGVGNLLQTCDAGGMAKDEYKDCTHHNQLVLVQVPYMMREAQNVNAGYWNLAAKKEDRPFRIVNTSLNAVQTLGMMGMLPWGSSYGSSSGSSVTITAKDGSRIENLDMTQGNQSPFVAGSDNLTGSGESAVAKDEGMAATDGGQNIPGTGNTTGRTISRPLTQSDLQFAGDGGGGDDSPGGSGDNLIDSGGLGFEGAL